MAQGVARPHHGQVRGPELIHAPLDGVPDVVPLGHARSSRAAGPWARLGACRSGRRGGAVGALPQTLTASALRCLLSPRVAVTGSAQLVSEHARAQPPSSPPSFSGAAPLTSTSSGAAGGLLLSRFSLPDQALRARRPFQDRPPPLTSRF